MTCGERIRQEREKRRMSQEDLAERMEVSRQAVSKWESDRSRPTKEKLEKLSALFGLPTESWEPPPLPEQTALCRWKAAAVILAAVLCLTWAVGWLLWPREEETEDQAEAYVDTSYIFPKTLPLVAGEVEDFGHWSLPPGDPEAVTEEKEQDGEAETVFIDQFPGSSWLRIIRGNPVAENHTTFYDVYALYLFHITVPDAQLIPLGRLADYNHYVGSGLDGAAYFTNVLGHDGWKITLSEGAACVTSWYFCVGEDGVPYVLLEASGSGEPQECDVDGDGEKEVVTSFGLPMGWTIYDAKADGRCVAYTLDQDGYGQTPVSFSAEEGFAVTDSVGTVMVRYLLAENQLVRQPQTDFSLADYADAAGTRLTFSNADPDQVVYNGAVRVTLRQQAYLALQELYGITGLTVDAAFCTVSGDGTATFSVDAEGEQVFFQMNWSRNLCGGAEQPGCSLTWRSEADWSPLEDRFAARPESGSAWTDPERTLAWLYRRMDRLRDGELITVARDPADEDQTEGPARYLLYLSDGGYYEAFLTGSGLLDSFSGPYPAIKS